MNKEIIQAIDNKIFESSYIKEIIDLSDDFSRLGDLPELPGFEFIYRTIKDISMARMRIIFFNNYELSVIRGTLSYGGDQGLFEIAAFNSLGDMDDSLFDKEEQGGTVLGHCSIERVQYYINKIGSISTTKNLPIDTKLVGFDAKIN